MVSGYLAPHGFEKDLNLEILRNQDLEILFQKERLFVVKGPSSDLMWSQWTLSNLQKHEFESITKAAQFLKSQGKFWLSGSQHLHRRTQLIEEKLPKVPQKKLNLGAPLMDLPCGGWFLESENILWWSVQPSLPYKNGEISFVGDEEAPSRAYMKLWEAFARIGKAPQTNQKVIDLGSCPGGWTWVLAQLAGKVISVDTAPLDPKVSKKNNVQFLKKDAFKLEPSSVGPVDWLFSDIICYPDKLFDLVMTWQESGFVKNWVCTIKFQGPTDFAALERFQKIPGSKIMHLNANKHELTWVLLDKDARN